LNSANYTDNLFNSGLSTPDPKYKNKTTLIIPQRSDEAMMQKASGRKGAAADRIWFAALADTALAK
jgi:hypothetical protein